MSENFMSDSSESDSASVDPQASTDPSSGRDFVKLIVVGSPKGVTKIIHAQYRLGFAEVTEWSPPVPTANPREVMSVLRRRVLLN